MGNLGEKTQQNIIPLQPSARQRPSPEDKVEVPGQREGILSVGLPSLRPRGKKLFCPLHEKIISCKIQTQIFFFFKYCKYV